MRSSHVAAWGGFLATALLSVGAFAAKPEKEPLYTVLNPIGNPPPIERRAMAARPASLAGKKIYLVDVTFNGGDLFLNEMKKWIEANIPDVTPIYRAKKGAYSNDDPELWREIQAENGVMIMAIGH
jgi:hypothetical protein